MVLHTTRPVCVESKQNQIIIRSNYYQKSCGWGGGPIGNLRSENTIVGIRIHRFDAEALFILISIFIWRRKMLIAIFVTVLFLHLFCRYTVFLNRVICIECKPDKN